MKQNNILEEMIYIKQKYRSLFDAALYYHMCNIKNIKSIENSNGVSLNVIFELNEYNNTIDSMRLGKNINNKYTQMVNKYLLYFEKYSDESFKIKQNIGNEKTMYMLDVLYRYFKLFGELFHYDVEI
jgi:hypothetical protein